MHWLAVDLRRQLDRTVDPARVAELTLALDGIVREQQTDRQQRPKRRKERS